MNLRLRNRKRFNGWFIDWESWIFAGKAVQTSGRSVRSIRALSLFVFYFLLAMKTGRSPFLAGISLVSVEQWVRSIFRISSPTGEGRRKCPDRCRVRQDRGEIDVPSISCRIAEKHHLGPTGGQERDSPVEHRPRVGSWSPDMRFMRGDVAQGLPRVLHRFLGVPYPLGGIQDLI